MAARRALAVCGCWLVFCSELGAAEPMTIQSQSGQFVVRGQTLIGAPPEMRPGEEGRYVRMDPTVVAVSCERIKQALLERLGLEDRWRSRVLVAIHPVTRNGEPIVVRAIRFRDTWQYRVELPEYVERERLLTTLIELMLLEIANRGSRGESAELPVWLGVGLGEVLDAESPLDLILQPDRLLVRQFVSRDPMREVRQLLQARPPLTLEELNWPTEEQVGGPDAAVFAGCAHLMVWELLALRGGGRCVADLLALMPEHLNWQAAFLRAFEPHFKSMLDLDKWWSLILVHQTGRDVSFTWSEAVSWERLDEILAARVQVRLAASDLPQPAEASLQSMIREWEYRRQLPVLTAKLNHLHALRQRVSQDLLGLVDDYRAVLAAYLDRRSKPGPSKPGTQFMVSNSQPMIDDILRRLDVLDREREALRARRTPQP